MRIMHANARKRYHNRRGQTPVNRFDFFARRQAPLSRWRAAIVTIALNFESRCVHIEISGADSGHNIRLYGDDLEFLHR